jgi:nucleoid-associated protein EbfC
MDIDHLNTALDDLLEQVHADTERIAALQNELQHREIAGYAADGEVTVRLAGTGQVLSVVIDPDTMRRYDADTVGSLVVVALNDGLNRLHAESQAIFAPLYEHQGYDK